MKCRTYLSSKSTSKPSPGFFNVMTKNNFKVKFRKFVIYNFGGDTEKAAHFYRITETTVIRLMYGEIKPTQQMIDDIIVSTEAV